MKRNLRSIIDHAKPEPVMITTGQLALKGTLPSWARNSDYYKEVTHAEIKELERQGWKVEFYRGTATMGTTDRFGHSPDECGYMSAPFTRIRLSRVRKSKKKKK